MNNIIRYDNNISESLKYPYFFLILLFNYKDLFISELFLMQNVAYHFKCWRPQIYTIIIKSVS